LKNLLQGLLIGPQGTTGLFQIAIHLRGTAENT